MLKILSHTKIPLGESSACLGMGAGITKCLVTVWNIMVSRKSHKCFSVSWMLPQTASLTTFGKGGSLKHWMIEQPVDSYIKALISYKKSKK